MLAVIGTSLLQQQALETFHPLGKNGWVRPWEAPGHLDGWGIVKYTPHGPVEVARSAGDVDVEASAYAAASSEAVALEGRLVITHFRKATEGQVCVANVHPFVEGRWVFCHNGTVLDLDKLGPRPTLQGTTDSEEFFRRWCAQGQGITSYPQWIDHVTVTCRYTALTSLLADGEHLLACRRSSGLLCTPPPAQFAPAYLAASYRLHYWTDGVAHVLCSEVLPVFHGAWHDFADGEMKVLAI